METQPVYDNDGRCIGQLQPVADPAHLHFGIADHSRPQLRLVIISAYQSGFPDYVNAYAHTALLRAVRALGVDCGEVDGCYKGARERSVLCEYRNNSTLVLLLELARERGQESALLINSDREASLYFFRGRYANNGAPRSDYIETIGKLVPVSPTKAETLDAWTRTKTGQYYAVL